MKIISIVRTRELGGPQKPETEMMEGYVCVCKREKVWGSMQVCIDVYLHVGATLYECVFSCIDFFYTSCVSED